MEQETRSIWVRRLFVSSTVFLPSSLLPPFTPSDSFLLPPPPRCFDSLPLPPSFSLVRLGLRLVRSSSLTPSPVGRSPPELPLARLARLLPPATTVSTPALLPPPPPDHPYLPPDLLSRLRGLPDLRPLRLELSLPLPRSSGSTNRRSPSPMASFGRSSLPVQLVNPPSRLLTVQVQETLRIPKSTLLSKQLNGNRVNSSTRLPLDLPSHHRTPPPPPLPSAFDLQRTTSPSSSMNQVSSP